MSDTVRRNIKPTFEVGFLLLPNGDMLIAATVLRMEQEVDMENPDEDSYARWVAKAASELEQSLLDDIEQLESQLHHFHETPPDRRFDDEDTYRDLIALRRDMLLWVRR